MADKFEKASDTELRIIGDAPETIKSKDQISNEMVQNRREHDNIQNSLDYCDAQYAILEAQLKQADDLGIKFSDELQVAQEPAEGLGQSNQVK